MGDTLRSSDNDTDTNNCNTGSYYVNNNANGANNNANSSNNNAMGRTVPVIIGKTVSGLPIIEHRAVLVEPSPTPRQPAPSPSSTRSRSNTPMSRTSSSSSGSSSGKKSTPTAAAAGTPTNKHPVKSSQLKNNGTLSRNNSNNGNNSSNNNSNNTSTSSTPKGGVITDKNIAEKARELSSLLSQYEHDCAELKELKTNLTNERHNFVKEKDEFRSYMVKEKEKIKYEFETREVIQHEISNTNTTNTTNTNTTTPSYLTVIKNYKSELDGKQSTIEKYKLELQSNHKKNKLTEKRYVLFNGVHVYGIYSACYICICSIYMRYT